MNLKRLSEPFDAKDIEWRVQSAGLKDNKVWARVLAYVTNRAVMNRLDEVFGVDGWKNELVEISKGSFICGISFLRPDGVWITKWDGCDASDIEPVKGAISGAMKRSAVLLGIGRYLYDLDAGYAIVTDSGIYRQSAGKDKNGKETYPAFKWNPPMLPKWALPDGNTTKPDNNDRFIKVTRMFEACKIAGEVKVAWDSLSKDEQIQFKELKDFTKKRMVV